MLDTSKIFMELLVDFPGKERKGEVLMDLSKFTVRTDLAVEAREMVIAEREKDHVHGQEDISQVEGVIIKEKEENNIKVSLVEITKEGSDAVGKKKESI